MAVEPWALLVPPSKMITADRLTAMAELRPVSTAGGPIKNPFAGRFPGGVLVEPYLTITNRCYLVANPAIMPFLEAGFLNGVTEPALMFKKPDTVRISGGDDRWGYEFDDIEFKIRHDWGSQLAYHQGIVAIGGGIS